MLSVMLPSQGDTPIPRGGRRRAPLEGMWLLLVSVRGKVGQAVSVLLQHRHHFLYQPFLFFVAGNGYLAVLDPIGDQRCPVEERVDPGADQAVSVGGDVNEPDATTRVGRPALL